MRSGACTKAANPPNGWNTENNQSLRVFRVIRGSFYSPRRHDPRNITNYTKHTKEQENSEKAEDGQRFLFQKFAYLFRCGFIPTFFFC